MNYYEYEQAILSILLVDNNKIDLCYLDEKHFLNNFNKTVYRVIKQTYSIKRSVSTVDLLEDLQIKNNFDYITKIIESYISSSNFETLMSLVLESYNKSLFQSINDRLQNKDITYDEAMDQLKETSEIEKDTSTATKLSVNNMYELITSSNETLKFHEYKNIENKIQLLQGTLNVIGARTSVGKSAFALNLLNDLSVNYNCLYLNMEMTEKQVYERLVGMHSNTVINKFGEARTNKTIQESVQQAINNLSTRRFAVYNGSKSVQSIRKIIQKNSIENHTIVFVDYVGFVTNNKKQNDRERVGDVVRELQRMVMDYDITMILLAQINRDGTGEPRLEHLKDSGELEQSAHSVILLHDSENDVNDMQPTYELIVAKNRSGRKGKLYMRFLKQNQKFKEVV